MWGCNQRSGFGDPDQRSFLLSQISESATYSSGPDCKSALTKGDKSIPDDGQTGYCFWWDVIWHQLQNILGI